MLEELKKIAAEYTEQEITEETKLRSDLGLSSFDLVSLIADIEEKYNIKVNDEDIASLTTVKDLMNYIETHK